MMERVCLAARVAAAARRVSEGVAHPDSASRAAADEAMAAHLVAGLGQSLVGRLARNTCVVGVVRAGHLACE